MIIIIFLVLRLRREENRGTKVPLTPRRSFTQRLLICQDAAADTFSAAFVPETCTSIFPVNTFSGSLGNSRC